MLKTMTMLSIVLMMNTNYIDQLSTGEYGRYNCLPTAIEMACNIYGAELNTEEIMEENNLTDGSNFLDIVPYIDTTIVEYEQDYYIATKEELMQYLDEGVVVVTVKTRDLMEFMNSNRQTKGIYYGYANHAILIKAYTETEFLIDDPFSDRRKYKGEYVGRNIFVPHEYLIKTSNDYLIIKEKTTHD